MEADERAADRVLGPAAQVLGQLVDSSRRVVRVGHQHERDLAEGRGHRPPACRAGVASSSLVDPAIYRYTIHLTRDDTAGCCGLSFRQARHKPSVLPVFGLPPRVATVICWANTSSFQRLAPFAVSSCLWFCGEKGIVPVTGRFIATVGATVDPAVLRYRAGRVLLIVSGVISATAWQ
jgi:hypothetical protein